MMMTLMMMNCFCGMAHRGKTFTLTSNRDFYRRFSPSQISDTPQAGFEPAPEFRFCWISLCCSDTNYTMAPLSPVEYLILESLTLYWNLIKPQQNTIFSIKYLNDTLKATLRHETNALTFPKHNFLHFSRFLQKNLKWLFEKGNQVPQNYWNYRSVRKISREKWFWSDVGVKGDCCKRFKIAVLTI